MKKETGYKPPKDINEYLLDLPEKVQLALEDLRETILSAAPGLEEAIHYHIPTFKYKGRPVVGFAAFKKHCGFYVMSPSLMPSFEADLKSLDWSGATIRFVPDKPLPKTLVERIVRARIGENEARMNQ